MLIGLVGGSGFIGTRLAQALLERGHAIRIFDKAPSEAYPQYALRGDVRDAAALSQALQGCTLAIDLAAEHRDDVRPATLYDEVNVGGARNVAEALERHGIERVIFVSSVAVYGLRQPMADENAPLRPAHPYGHSKVEAEAVYRRWAQSAPTRTLTIVRPCVVFGEGNRGNVHVLIEHLRRGRFARVGRGEQRKSIAYVGNLVDFLCSRLDAPAGVEVFNYADAPPRMSELIGEIHALLPAATPLPPRVPYALALAGAAALQAIALLRGRPAQITPARLRRFLAATTVATSALQRTGFIARVARREALVRTIAALPALTDS